MWAPKHKYDQAFMQYAADSSAYSAQVITAYLASLLGVSSVLDVGCALGTWLRAWLECGVTDIHGIDGEYVSRTNLRISQDKFTAADLNCAFNLGRQFDLVQSLEVAEHISPRASLVFADGLARHAKRYVLFSAAPPGQGGESHINERPYQFWRSALAQHGFVAVDAVRPAIAGDNNISYWYRYNTFLYVRHAELQVLDQRLINFRVAEDQPLVDMSPLTFRVRKAIVQRLPRRVQDGVARLKSRVMPTGRF